MIKTILQAIKRAFLGPVEKPREASVNTGYNGTMEKDTEELQPGAQTGVLIKEPDPKAWVAGGETGIAAAVLEDSGQYDVYLPDEEAQSFYTPAHFDTQSCVTFSATNNIETLLNRMRAKKLLSKKQEDFLVNEGYINPQTGKVNFSDRFTAKMSGTTQAGNYLEAVGDSMRKDGLVPESAWPMPDWDALKGKTQNEIWAIYMADIPGDVKNKAKKFLEYFDINYQWVVLGATPSDADLKRILKQGPFQIAAIVCSPWNSNDGMPPIPACGCGTGHATLIYGYRPDDMARKDFDHYRSFRKLLASDYCIQWGLQYMIKEHTPVLTVPIQYVFAKQLKYGMPQSDEVNRLQKALQDLGHMTKNVFGPFGPQTRTALGRFQTDRGITDPDGQGTNFGPQTRAEMNAAIKKLTQ